MKMNESTTTESLALVCKSKSEPLRESILPGVNMDIHSRVSDECVLDSFQGFRT